MTLDFIALAIGYAIGTAFLLFGYMAAGQVWVERHSITLTGPGHARRVSGFWGEFFLFTACVGVAATVRAFTDVAIVANVIAPYWGWAVGVFACVAALVLIYSASVVSGAKRDGHDAAYRGKLAAAYLFYSVYCAILFAGGLMVIALLGVEFAADQVKFEEQAAVVRASVDSAIAAANAPGDAAGNSRLALTHLEDAMGEIAIGQTLLQDQMNPVFIFAAVIFAVNILIVLSPIRSAFMQGAIDLTHILTGVAIGGVLIAGFISYFASYSDLIQDVIARLPQVRPSAELGAWELSQRFNEMLVNLARSKNLLGFAQTIGGEGSGVALFAGGVQFTLDRIPSKSEKIAGTS